MVPLPRYSTVAGIPITDLLSKEKIDAIVKRTAGGGLELVKLLGTSAWYAPGQAAAEMVEAILKDKKKILPCSVFLQGEYGINDLFVGVPVKLGARGIETDCSDRADAGRGRGAEEVRRDGQGTRRRDRNVTSYSFPITNLQLPR
jgi:malate dehydrogenase